MNADQFVEGMMDISKALEELQEVPRLAVEKAAPKIEKIMVQDVAAGVDPQGQAWAPLKDGSGRTPFSSSDRMQRQIDVVPDGLKVRGRLRAPWNVHQYGSRNPRKGVAKRPIFQRNELPPSWDAAMTESAQEAFDEIASKVRK